MNHSSWQAMHCPVAEMGGAVIHDNAFTLFAFNLKRVKNNLQ